MAREVFIYWKVAPAQAQAAQTAALALQRELRAAHPELQARLCRKAEPAGASITVMEIYGREGGIGDGLLLAIESAAARHLLTCESPRRHVEVFDTVAA